MDVIKWNLSGKRQSVHNASTRRRVKSNPFTNNPKFQTEDVLNNPWNPENPWFENYLQELFPQKYPPPQPNRIPCTHSWFEIMRAAAIGWIKIFRILRINYNVVGCREKVIIRWWFHFRQPRKDGYKVHKLQLTIKPKPNTSSVILEVL